MEQYINKIINADCLDILKQLPDKCVDLVLTDPPYGYLDIEFDKDDFNPRAVFLELRRVLRDDSLIVFSGRGDSFYEWNKICAELGLPFKEEIVWDKNGVSGPFGVINRVHETIVIRGRKRLNNIKIDAPEYYQDITALMNAVKRFVSSIKQRPEEAVKFIQANKLDRVQEVASKYKVSMPQTTKTADRGLITLNSFINGFNAKSIFTIPRDNTYTKIHPTQKPVMLYERLLKICSNENDLVLDCFSGSGTTAVACHNLHRRFICIEKDPEYAKASQERLEQAQRQQTLF